MISSGYLQPDFLYRYLSKKNKKTPEGDPHRSGSAKTVPDRDPFSIGIFHARTGRDVRKAVVNSPIGLECLSERERRVFRGFSCVPFRSRYGKTYGKRTVYWCTVRFLSLTARLLFLSMALFFLRSSRRRSETSRNAGTAFLCIYGYPHKEGGAAKAV